MPDTQKHLKAHYNQKRKILRVPYDHDTNDDDGVDENNDVDYGKKTKVMIMTHNLKTLTKTTTFCSFTNYCLCAMHPQFINFLVFVLSFL